MTRRIETMARGFEPRNIAVIGAARHNHYSWLHRHLDFPRSGSGKLYMVNIDKDEWPGAQALGVPCVSSLAEIAEPIDYVTVAVPPKVAPFILKACIEKGVSVAHFFTAGFSDACTQEGIALEEELKTLAHGSGTLVMGPNCMGLYNARKGVRQVENFPSGVSGPVAFISQSGSQSIGFVTAAVQNGLGVSKSFSIGNAIDLDFPDLFAYLEQDADVEIVAAYVEGVRDTSRFFGALAHLAARKPVVVWKVGTTEDASRATEAHTGSAFVPDRLFGSLLASSGGLRVRDLEEMLNTVRLLRVLPSSAGPRIGLVAASGGHSSEMANVFAEAGFAIPTPSIESVSIFESFFSNVGGSFRNPVEGVAMRDPEVYRRSVDTLLGDPNIDMVAVEIPVHQIARDETLLDHRIEMFKHWMGGTSKPIAAVLTTTLPYVSSPSEKVLQRFEAEGIPFCVGFRQAADALAQCVHYSLIRASRQYDLDPTPVSGP